MIPPLSALQNVTALQPAAPTAPAAPVASAAADTGAASGGSFWDELKGAMIQSQQLQAGANDQISQLVNGTSQDIHSTAIAVEKSDLAFGMMLQLRNKAVAAYQDIAHMAF